ncbi:MAG: phage portal protein [Candidatus Hydrogenedentes bacterium]|nr:phage portal protein [Candidatus Hydrogenedentota bacterium]
MNPVAAFSGLRSDYEQVKANRWRSFIIGGCGQGTDGDFSYRSDADYYRIMSLARQFDENDSLIGQGLDRLERNVVQDGMQLDPKTGLAELNTYLAAKWSAWCDTPEACDMSQERDFHGMARMVLRSVIRDGDILALMTNTGAVELIEGHRLKTPHRTRKSVVHGILIDRYRRKLEYWITRSDLGILGTVTRADQVEKVPARDRAGNLQALHICDPRRVTQTRGVSALVRVFDMIGMLGDINFAKLVQQQILSCFAILRTRPLGGADGFGQPTGYGDSTTEAKADGSGTELLEGIGPGMEVTGEPGEQLEGFSPNVPGQGYFEQAKLIITIIAINLGLPVHVLLLDPSDTNFSGWRGAIDQARLGWRHLQYGILVKQFYRPVYQWKLRDWLVTDPELRRLVATLDNPEDVFKARFLTPRFPYIQPEVDAQADAEIIGKMLDSRRGVLAMRGRDIEHVDQEIVDDNASLITRALEKLAEIKGKFGELAEDVSWRDMLGLWEVQPGSAPAAAGQDGAKGRKVPKGKAA